MSTYHLKELQNPYADEVDDDDHLNAIIKEAMLQCMKDICNQIHTMASIIIVAAQAKQARDYDIQHQGGPLENAT